MKKKIIALMGKAGSGKDTILKKVVSNCPEKFSEIVSCTTRPPREGERDGINYFFMTKEQFKQRIPNMIEYNEFNGWFYGTEFLRLKDNKINIGVFNPQGIIDMCNIKDIELKVYFIDCTDKTRLLRQLNREENPLVKEIIRRYSADEQDFQRINCLQYITVRNEDLIDLEQIVQLIISENLL